MALATSGHGLELLHSKTVPRWCWVAFWTAAAVAVGIFIPAIFGLAGYSQTYAVIFGAIALLPLVSTGRKFVHLCQWGGPVIFLMIWFAFARQGFVAGRWVAAGFWGPLLCFDVFLLLFRNRHFVCGVFITLLLGFVVNPPLACVYFGTLRAARFATYAACVVTKYRTFAPLYSLLGSFLLFLVGHKYANDLLTSRAARASRERHRLLASSVCG